MGVIRKNKKSLFILTVVIMLLIAGGMAIRAVDKALNKSIGKEPHTEIMLWQSPGYSSNRQLFFFGTEVLANSDKIIVNYKIENKSDKEISIGNLIDVGLVKADANTIGDPGTLIWLWSENPHEEDMKNIELASGEIYQKDIEIDRRDVKVQFQYYINAYYDRELVAQYKIIEGIYK